jgi:hypothetical protein
MHSRAGSSRSEGGPWRVPLSQATCTRVAKNGRSVAGLRSLIMAAVLTLQANRQKYILTNSSTRMAVARGRLRNRLRAKHHSTKVYLSCLVPQCVEPGERICSPVFLLGKIRVTPARRLRARMKSSASRAAANAPTAPHNAAIRFRTSWRRIHRRERR